MDDASPKQEFRDCEGSLDLDISTKSPAILRLIQEVRAEAFEVPRSYNRTFNRHNR